MFLAIDTQTKEPVISLDACWEGQPEALRVRAGQLECSVCHGPVTSRAGEQKRWHFAHRNANDCPLSHSDPDRMVGRAMIFLWLASKGLRDKLTIEECITVGGKLHQIDCSVSLAEDLNVSYLFLTQGVRDRDALLAAMRSRYSHCYFIFHAKTVRPAEGNPGCIMATPTHRSAAHFYDDCSYYHDVREPVLAPGSIHALDPEEAKLITYRSLRC